MCDEGNNTTQVNFKEAETSLHVPDIFLMFAALLGVLLNGLLLIFGRKRLPKSCSLFICNLAVADLITSFVAVILGFRRMIMDQIFRRIIVNMSWCTVLASFLTLLGIALQRYVAVVHSMWSHSRMKNYQWIYKLIIIGIWSVTFIFAALLNYYNFVTRLIITCLWEIMIIVIIALYLKIYLSFRSYRVKNEEGIFATNQRHLNLNLKKEAKLSVVVCCVTAMLFFAVLPNVIILQIGTSMMLAGNAQEMICNDILHDFNSYWVIIEVLGFSLNPLIYFWHLQITNKIGSESIERFRNGIGVPKRRIVPEISIMPSPTTEMTKMTNSICPAERVITHTNNTTVTSSCGLDK